MQQRRRQCTGTLRNLIISTIYGQRARDRFITRMRSTTHRCTLLLKAQTRTVFGVIWKMGCRSVLCFVAARSGSFTFRRYRRRCISYLHGRRHHRSIIGPEGKIKHVNLNREGRTSGLLSSFMWPFELKRMVRAYEGGSAKEWKCRRFDNTRQHWFKLKICDKIADKLKTAS